MSESSFHVSSRSRTWPIFLVFLAAGVAIYGVLAAPERTWPNLLLDGFYVATLGVSAVFFLAVTRAAGARWSANLRRVPEALSGIMPVAAILLALVYFGRHTLFPWTHPNYFAGAKPNAGNAHFLNPPWVFTRMASTLVVWIFFSWLFRRTSLQQDRDRGASLALHHRLNRYSIIFLLFFALTFTFGVYDWLLSLDPQWSSTMFGFYTFAGTFVQGIAAVTLAVVMLRERGTLTNVGEHQLHDLGKMLFAFTIFWAYIWTCQYLLIWYGNIPDEVTHYARRTNGLWLYLFALNFILNWIVPFLTLLSIRAKRTPELLKIVCMVVLAGHWLDLYLLIMPAVWPKPAFGPIEVAIAAGYVSLVYLVFIKTLQKAPLAPVHDPILAYERLHIYTAELHTS